MNVESLRPEVRPLDAEWSATTLEAILSSHTQSPSHSKPTRRRFALVGAATAAVLGVGGVAYATGLVPGFVDDELDWISTSDVADVHEVASFSLESHGKTRAFEIWRGTNEDGMSCAAVLEAEGQFGPNFGGYCGDNPTDAWFDRTSEPYTGTINDAPPPSTYFVYGEPDVAGVTSVRVFGKGFDHSVAVDRTTGGYAVAIPELGNGLSGHFATVQFLDPSGTVVGTRQLSEK